MQKLTEQQILSWAPNAAAAANGRKISKGGGFVRLEVSEDHTFYLGECKGSGKSNYITTADFVDAEEPIFRCSCPSRQFPCKHSLALLYEILEQKTFDLCEIPEDIRKKRERKLAREAKAAQNMSALGEAENAQVADMEAGKNAAASMAKSVEKSSSKSKTAKSARAKKIKKQLEGLDLLEKMTRNLLQMGLGTMGGSSLATYRDLSKQLGDYYLPGPQRLLNGLILQIEAFQKDGQELHYEAAIDILKKIWALTKKSRQYLLALLETETAEQDYNVLYEELGGIWKMTELEALGGLNENVYLVQLSFWVTYDEARKEFIDTGCWVDLESGEVHITYNYRPLKALKYVKAEDSMFEKLRIQKLVRYPGEGNLRVRWEGGAFYTVTREDLQQIRRHAATSLKAEVKAAKNLLKNPLSPSMWIRLIAYETVGLVDGKLILRTADKDTIYLKDMPEMEKTVAKFGSLSDVLLFYNQVLLGAFFYDVAEQRLLMQPLAIVSERGIVRLLY